MSKPAMTYWEAMELISQLPEGSKVSFTEANGTYWEVTVGKRIPPEGGTLTRRRPLREDERRATLSGPEYLGQWERRRYCDAEPQDLSLPKEDQ